MKLIYFCLIILILSSCSPLVQKAFFVESPNVAAFDSVKDANMNLSGQYLTHLNFQFSRSFTPHSGLVANVLSCYQGNSGRNDGYDYFYPRPKHDSYAYAIGAGYVYYSTAKSGIFECSASYNFQKNKHRLSERGLSPIAYIGLSGPWLSQDIDASFHSVIIQPSWIWVHDGIKAGFTLKNLFTYIPNYYYFFNIGVYNPDAYYLQNEFEDEVIVSNKFVINQQLFFIFRNEKRLFHWGFHVGIGWPLLFMQRKYSDLSYYDAALPDVIPINTPSMASIAIGFDLGLPFFR